jgi:hypothetical protein
MAWYMHSTLRPNLLVALRSLGDPESPVADFERALAFIGDFVAGPDGSIDPDLHEAFVSAQVAIRMRRQLNYKLKLVEEDPVPGEELSLSGQAADHAARALPVDKVRRR